ncbi:DNA internalization-related competence protein ComEC/Rec2 [Bacillus litorisediminis]|uniref:DNA internalization-related competence protein ComEC/Rec2 n=1 Tax=Bacillus litorisediminis TaxID=2922713 RepID=UPI002434AAA4|nr:DNA internalization-related competence protein ComEC/Rec2 [Bacillus litorisediminis]
MSLRNWFIFGGCAITAIHLVHSEQAWILWFLSIFLGIITMHYKLMRQYGLLMMASLFFFSFIAQSEMEPLSNWENGEKVQLTVRFTDFLKDNGDTQSSIVTTENGEKLLFRSSILEDRLEQFIEPGIVCQFAGLIEEPARASNFNAFNYRNYLHSQEVFWIFEAQSFQKSDCMPNPVTLSFTSLQYLQEWMIKQLKQSLPSPTKEIVLALVLGNRIEMDSEVKDAYEKLGIVHLLAISGLNIGLITAVLFGIFIRAGLTREGSTTLLLTVLPIYAVLAGASPSVVRAVFMAWIVLLCYLFKVRLSIIHVFFISFTVILIFQPFSIYAVGFQLSYGVTLSLLLSIRHILALQITPWKASLAVSFVSSLSSLPFLLYHFFSFSPYSILLNLLYVPLFSLILLPLSWILALLVLAAGSAPAFLVTISNHLITAADEIALFMMDIPYTSIILGRPSLIQIVIIIMGFLLVFILMEARKGKWFMYFPIFTLICFDLILPKPSGEITAINVGQGDAILINLPYNAGTYLIDSGRSDENQMKAEESKYIAAETVIIPYLHSLGITEIDKFLITHGDNDHAGGALTLMEDLKINEVVIGKKSANSDLEIEIVGNAKKADIPIKVVQKGDYWKTGNGHYVILAPEGTETNENDSSIVLHATIGQESFLFTGDISIEKEERLVRLFPNLKADYLKVGHHGSQTSTGIAFLKAVSPNMAIISVGKNNWYGHPHQEVLKNLKKQDIQLFRTDQNGAIQYKLNLFSNGTIKTVLP